MLRDYSVSMIRDSIVFGRHQSPSDTAKCRRTASLSPPIGGPISARSTPANATLRDGLHWAFSHDYFSTHAYFTRRIDGYDEYMRRICSNNIKTMIGSPVGQAIKGGGLMKSSAMPLESLLLHIRRGIDALRRIFDNIISSRRNAYALRGALPVP